MPALLLPLLAISTLLQQGPRPEVVAPHADTQPTRWIVTFEKRSFDLSRFRTAIRTGAGAEAVAAAVAELQRNVVRDQAEFTKFITRLGGRVVQRYWIINGCLIEIDASHLDTVRRQPNVLFLHRDELVQPAAILTATNVANHSVDPLYRAGIRGKGASVAIVDTGQDSSFANTGRPHATYFVNGDTNNKTGGGLSGSRLLANYKIGIQPADDVVGHGTGVAGIVAGERWNTYKTSDRGHAPLAGIVGYAIADAVENGSAHDSTIVSAWQQVATDRTKHNIVAANNSYSGRPDPTHPTQQALDSAATNADILITVAAGNYGTNTRYSQSVANGLAVGAVEADNHKVASFSAVGPLPNDPTRFYPDLVANGVDMVMPLRDNVDPGSDYRGSGTSFAAPEVCGAAVLFRSLAPKATHLETKAAILTGTEDVSSQNAGKNRNSFGAGYLRDDAVVARAQGKGLVASGSLTSATPSMKFRVPVVKGQSYAAAVAWDRHVMTSVNWSNLDLRVVQGTTTIASSTSPHNLWERVAFVAPSSGVVDLVVTSVTREIASVPFGIAFGPTPAPFTKGAMQPYGKGCPGTGIARNLSVVLPAGYDKKFGNGADSTSVFGYANHHFQQIFDPKQVSKPFGIVGVAFRQDDQGKSKTNPWWVELEIDLGYSSNTPATMSRSFAANITGTPTRVLQRRRVSLPAWSGRNTNPANFGVRTPFDRQFNYLPKAGQTLLFDSRRTAGPHLDLQKGEFFFVDGVADSSLPVSSLYGLQLNRGSGVVMGFLTPQTGVAPQLSSSGLPAVGGEFRLQIRQARAQTGAIAILGTSDKKWLSLTLPLDLTPFGAKGCSLLTAFELASAVNIDAFGEADLAFPVPDQPALLSAVLFHQVLVVDPANALGLVGTNGLRTQLGGHR